MSAVAQRLARDELAGFLPHQGPMLLLEQVESWDDAVILCSAVSHNDAGNPLRVNGRLSTVHAMEYGAQAAAVHLFVLAESQRGPLADMEQMPVGKIVYLGVVRDFECCTQYLDEQPDSTLQIRSELIAAAPRIFQYHVSASIAGTPCAQGNISLIVGN